MHRTLWLVLLISVIVMRILFYSKNQYVYSDGIAIRIRDTVTSEPLRLERSQYLILKGYKIYLPRYPEINYGDNLIVEGVVDGDNLEEVKLIDCSSSDGILISIRNKLMQFFQRSLPARHAGLVAGVVLGSKDGIDDCFWEELKKSGTVHVVVASGMNVSIVAGFLISLFALFMSRRRAIPFVLVGIWLYSILSGFDAPLVRASIMGSIAFTAQELGKLYYAGRALVITAALMVFIKPEWIFDLGFILSFVATASILLIEEPIKNKLVLIPGILRSDLSATLSAQLGVAPILYASFGQFNILSPLYNVSVLWTIPIITLIGMISGIISFMCVPLATLILYLTYPFTSWFIFCTTYM